MALCRGKGPASGAHCSTRCEMCHIPLPASYSIAVALRSCQSLFGCGDQYVPYGMHHGDAGYDVTDPELSLRQREIVEFSASWFNRPREERGPDAVVPYTSNPALTRMHALASADDSAVELVSSPTTGQWAGPRGTGVVPFEAKM